MTPAATCRSVNHTLTHREANALELALSRSRSPHNAPHSPSILYTLHANTVRISAYSTHVHTFSSGGTIPSVLRRFNLRLVHSALAHELPVSAPPHSAISFQRIMLGIKHTNTIAECSQLVGYGSQCRHDFGSLLKLLYPLIPLARSGAAGKEQTEKFLSSHR